MLLNLGSSCWYASTTFVYHITMCGCWNCCGFECAAGRSAVHARAVFLSVASLDYVCNASWMRLCSTVRPLWCHPVIQTPEFYDGRMQPVTRNTAFLAKLVNFRLNSQLQPQILFAQCETLLVTTGSVRIISQSFFMQVLVSIRDNGIMRLCARIFFPHAIFRIIGQSAHNPMIYDYARTYVCT